MLLPIAMKSILAIFAIGLMLATAFSGCVGGENTNGTDTTYGTDITGTDGTGNETGNETLDNQTTSNVTKNKPYHKEYDESLTVMDSIDHTFPVKQNATKFTVVVSATCLIPDPTGEIGLFVYLYAPGAADYIEAWTVCNSELIIEMTRDEIVQYGYGTWNVQFIGCDPQITAQTVIDVLY
jgi:hypothetical protein